MLGGRRACFWRVAMETVAKERKQGQRQQHVRVVAAHHDGAHHGDGLRGALPPLHPPEPLLQLTLSLGASKAGPDDAQVLCSSTVMPAARRWTSVPGQPVKARSTRSDSSRHMAGLTLQRMGGRSPASTAGAHTLRRMRPSMASMKRRKLTFARDITNSCRWLSHTACATHGTRA